MSESERESFDDYVVAVVDQAPPLTKSQQDRIGRIIVRGAA